MTRPGSHRRLLAWGLTLTVPALAGCDPLAAHAPGVVVLPWRLVVGVLLAEAVLLRRVRRLPRRRVLATAGALLGGAAATFAGRWWLVPATFFHQNGQGPLWTAYALCHRHGFYGPGYAEVTGWIPTLSAQAPEHALFLAFALAAATVPVSAWIGLRALRVRAPIAWAAFAALAASPALARAGQSESYYGVCAALLFGAAALLAVGGAGRRRLDLGLAVAGAGLLVAEAARVHPVCWLAAAVLPGVLLVSRGRLRRRLRRVVVAGLGVGLVVAVTTGPALLGVVTGSLGHAWLAAGTQTHHRLADRLGAAATAAAALMPLAVVLALVAGRRRGWLQGPLRALALLGVVALMAGTRLVGPVIPAIAAAHLALWVPVPLALVATGLSEAVPGPRTAMALAVLLVVVGVGADLVQAPRMIRPPTDVLEAQAVLAWRREMPRGAGLLYLSNAGSRVLNLPVYDCDAAGARSLRFRDNLQLLPDLGADGPLWYLRDSLCSTPEGRPLCRRVEARLRRQGWRFEEKATRRLPARLSMVGLGYPARTVDITLFALHRRSVPGKAPAP